MRWDIVDKAFDLGADDFGLSKRKNKRFYVIYDGRKINFGDPNANTYFDGASEQKRNSFRARHQKIKLKNGTYAYKNKNQPSFWSYNLLW